MILIEERFTDIQTITEGTEGNKHLYLQGVFMESEQQNRNGRTYQKAELEKAVQKVNEAALAGRHILGHLDHPPSLEVKLADVSHKILEMKMHGNDAIGKSQILESTPNGQIVKGLINDGVNLGVSSRGAGQVNEDTGIVEGFNFITVDIVANPSAINAYPTSVMEELQMYRKGELVRSLANDVIHDQKAQKYFQKELQKFLQTAFNK